jgi:hypothetical protein
LHFTTTMTKLKESHRNDLIYISLIV